MLQRDTGRSCLGTTPCLPLGQRVQRLVGLCALDFDAPRQRAEARGVALGATTHAARQKRAGLRT